MKKKSKVLVPLILVLVMVFSVASVAQATDYTENDLSTGTTLYPGDTISVTSAMSAYFCSSYESPSSFVAHPGVNGGNRYVIQSGSPLTVPDAEAAWDVAYYAFRSTVYLIPARPTGEAPVITTEALANGTVGTAYSQALTASGTDPITWSLGSFQAQSAMTAMAGDTLPPGLSLSGNQITGTPTQAGTFTFTLTAANNFGSDAKEFSITIAEADQETDENGGGSDNGNNGEGATTADPPTDNTPSTGTGSTSTTTESSPKTADASRDLPVGLIMVCAVAGIVCAIVGLRRVKSFSHK